MIKEQKNNDFQLLCQTLNKIIESKEYTTIVKSFDDIALEYGIIGQKMQKTKFNQVKEENFWEFVYNGILNTITPTPEISFDTVKAFGNLHTSAMISINNYVRIVILNSDHKYDEWLEQLKEKYDKKKNTINKKCRTNTH